MAPLTALRSALCGSELLDDPAALLPYASDASPAEAVLPRAVVRARSVDDVQATLRWAWEHGVPVTPRGAGTGKAGGCVPEPGGIVLSLAELRSIRQVRPEHGWAEVEPGVVTGVFRQAMESEYGLFYPPDPGSMDECTLGGNVATNAGGPVALRYGVTGDQVLGLEAVLADGSRITTGRRQPKSVAGYDLTSLLVGSEGTLAVITGIRLALAPRPVHIVAAWLPFESVADAAAAVLAARRGGLEPRALELYDSIALQRAGRSEDFPSSPDWGALLLLELEGAPGVAEAKLRSFAEGLSRPPLALQLVSDEAERRELWALRYRTSREVKRGALGWLTEDIAVPLGSIPAMLEALEPIGARHDLIVFGYGHAGDGNLHVNLLWEEPSGAARVEGAAEEVMRAAVELGGTISAEHGIGLLKKRFLPLEHGERELELQRGIKAQWDPRGILNPGKLLPAAG